MTKTELTRLKKVPEAINGLLQTIRSMEQRHSKMAFNTAEERKLATKIHQLSLAHRKLVSASQGIIGFLL